MRGAAVAARNRNTIDIGLERAVECPIASSTSWSTHLRPSSEVSPMRSTKLKAALSRMNRRAEHTSPLWNTSAAPSFGLVAARVAFEARAGLTRLRICR